MTGYIKLYRSIVDHPHYFKGKFDRVHAWIDLLLMANYKDSFIFVRGIRVEVRRGQIAKGIRDLSERWHWSPNTVRRYIKDLKMLGQIDTQVGNVISLITIVNYEKFQGGEDMCDTQSDTQIDTQTDTQSKEKISPVPPLKEIDKEGKEEKENQEDKSSLDKEKKRRSRNPSQPSRYVDRRPPQTDPIEVRKEWFKNEIRRVNENGKYDTDMCNVFYMHWAEMATEGGLMKFEKQDSWETSKRLATWYYNEKKRWNK